MKNLIPYFFMFFLSLTSIWAQFNPQSKKITEKFFPDTDKIKDVTPGLKKNKGFTNYEELISFLTTLQEEHSDWVTLEYIGASQKGLKIPLIKLTNHKLNQEKLKIWIQGGLHGNEPASSEGVLYILYTLLNDPEYKYLLNSIELAVVPMANIDGYLKQNRYAANGLDLNRDQTKLMAPESVAIKQAFSNFDPEVGLDFHEYNPYRRDFTKLHNYGIAAYYDAMMLYSGNLNVPKNIRQLTETLFVESTRKELEINNLTSRDYVSTEDFEGEIRFNRGSTNARSSATSYALTNTISTLVEVRGVGLDRTSFKRRIFTTFLIGMNYIKIAHKNAEIIKQEIAKARYNMGEITVTSSQEVYKDDILAIDLEADDLIKLPVTIRDALLSKPKLVRPLPEAYIINHNQPEIIEKMKVLGIKIDTLSEEKQFTVECYLISSIEDNSVPYEKMNLQKVTTEIVNRVIRFPKGTYIISTDQKNKPILTEVLEPEAPNSFISFGVLRTKLNEELPIYRLLKKN